MSYEIEKGVPMPSHIAARGKYPFPSMAVGDSFFAGAETVSRESLRHAGLYHTQKTGVRFKLYDAPGGWRVFRVA